MSSPLRPIGHHGEAIDPDLWDSIKHQIDDITGLDAVTIVVLIGVVIVALPLAVIVLAARKRRADATRNRTP